MMMMVLSRRGLTSKYVFGERFLDHLLWFKHVRFLSSGSSLFRQFACTSVYSFSNLSKTLASTGASCRSLSEVVLSLADMQFAEVLTLTEFECC